LTWLIRSSVSMTVIKNLGRHSSANSLRGKPIPATMGSCAAWPVSASWHCAAHSRTANAPRPRRGAGCPLESLSRESTGLNHDVRPAERHPRHCWPCAAAPVLAAPRRALLQQLRRCWARRNGTPPRLPLYPVRITVNGFFDPARGRDSQPLRLHPRSRLCSSTGRTATTRPGQGPPGRPPTPRRCTPYPHV
jgi:hypothetical protein